MSYLIAIDQKEKRILRPEIIKLFPNFLACSEQQLVTIILAYDYFSPYSQFPEEDRKRKALAHVYEDKEPDKFWELEKIKKSVEDYKACQFNPKQHLIEEDNIAILNLQKAIAAEKDPSELAKLITSQDKLRKLVKELEKEVHADIVERGVIMGNSNLSWLDIFQQNAKAYSAIKK